MTENRPIGSDVVLRAGVQDNPRIVDNIKVVFCLVQIAGVIWAVLGFSTHKFLVTMMLAPAEQEVDVEVGATPTMSSKFAHLAPLQLFLSKPGTI